MTKREQILKLADLKHNIPIHRQTEYHDGKEARQEELLPLLEAMASHLERLEAALEKIKDQDFRKYLSSLENPTEFAYSQAKGFALADMQNAARQALTAPGPLDALLEGQPTPPTERGGEDV